MENQILEIEDLKRILPQRYPFLMIDRVIYSGQDKVVALKNVSVNEGFFEGHFPDEKVMPGVLIIEAIAQTGIVLVHNVKSKEKKIDKDKKRIYFLGGINKVRFFQPVKPGDQLKIEVKPVKLISNIGMICGEVFVKDKKVAQAELSFSMKEID
ncbi:MAG: 3-hydroxyacyl-ACP dehydratase FabZ [Candidatus Omnitrophica bacterium]|nr:3-hydroxyacyl-ACP dehydratase FabZ [Candidatus Omnitrophota bacterium]MDD5352243.1 3-hydroxyacyl-ACP dehydratase FabZ [Candidatus Omnitrophota bacterium]MDD5549841.1 3-hydroxyacyl-ACP dehydratase FabZ [Candidatus Omnitrophota bacterium]